LATHLFNLFIRLQSSAIPRPSYRDRNYRPCPHDSADLLLLRRHLVKNLSKISPVNSCLRSNAKPPAHPATLASALQSPSSPPKLCPSLSTPPLPLPSQLPSLPPHYVVFPIAFAVSPRLQLHGSLGAGGTRRRRRGRR
jgi:hypothetical protein